ncbi:3-methyladenine DNA glycosylase [compost metagenome]
MNIFKLSTTTLAQSLLGMELIHDSNEGVTGGIITDVEAYLGLKDEAAHAYSGKITRRTELMYGPSGHACLYHIRGKNLMLNITSGKIGVPEIVFIRQIQPTIGIDLMLKRRKYCVQYGTENDFRGNKIKNLTNGPGKLCQAMGITTDYHGHFLLNEPLYIQPHSNNHGGVINGPRINIKENKDALLRYYI